MKTKYMSILLLLVSHFASAQWTTNGTNIYNSNSGNVGIGTANPQSKLHLKNGLIMASDPI